MNVVFLDIDGVLNNDKTNSKTPMGFTGISNSLLKNLAHFVKETNAVIVLSSTWKDEWDENPLKRTEDGNYLHRKLRQVGISIFGKIDESTTGSYYRGKAIKLYLDAHPEIENYVILDDLDFDFKDIPEIESHFVQTKASLGFQKDKYEKALQIMKQKENYLYQSF